MAITLKQKFTIDFGNVVRSSLAAVQAVRRSEQAKNEAEFQRAVADGLSYEEQLAIRQKQLEAAKSAGSLDEDYIAKLEEAISSTKRLARFNTYRTKYSETLAELSSGKINEETYLKNLKGMLSGVEDPELRLEIQGDITEAEKTVKQYRDTILSNRVRKAQYDGTQKALKDAVRKVKAARSEAALSQNEDEVTAYDETLAALNSQLSTVKIQDSITDFQVQSATRGTNPLEKLNYINDQVNAADPNSPIKIGDRTYESAAQFWALERDNYLGGNSQIFGNFFSELEAQSKDIVAQSVVQFGYPTQPVLDSTNQMFNTLRTRAEVVPFIGKLDSTKAVVMEDAVNKYADMVAKVSTNQETFKQADAALLAAQGKYGVDMSSWRIEIQGRAIQTEDESLVPEVNLSMPGLGGGAPITVNPPAAVNTTLPGAASVPGSVPINVPTNPATSTPTSTTPMTPVAGVPPTTEPNQSLATPNQSFKDTPLYTPKGGIGTISQDGKFRYTSSGWQPISGASAPTATTSSTTNQSLKTEPNMSVAPPKTPTTTPLKEEAPKPIVNQSFAPPTYTPASGIGTKSVDEQFIFTKEGWKPIQ